MVLKIWDVAVPLHYGGVEIPLQTLIVPHAGP